MKCQRVLVIALALCLVMLLCYVILKGTYITNNLMQQHTANFTMAE